MGISHPLSDDYDALRGAVLSPESTPPSSPPPPSLCCAPGDDYLEHQVSRMDTLAGIAIKYGVEISDIKRANGLVSDSQMFAHKTLVIPVPGKPVPSSMRLNGSGQMMKRARAPNHQQNRDVFGLLDDSPKSGRLGTSPAMSTLQRYYGLTSNTVDCSTEMSVYRKGSSFQNTTSAAPGVPGSWDCDDPGNVNGATNPNQDGYMRRRQRVEADDFLADPIKAIKSLLPRRPISVNMDRSNSDSRQKRSISFLNNVRKSSSTPNIGDTEENGTSMWSSSSTWGFNHESFTRPLLEQVSARKAKTAMD